MAIVFAAGERPRPGWVRRRPNAWIAAVGTVCFGAFMGQLDASVVALTYHSIGRAFGVGLASVQWVSLGYLIALGLLLVPIGRASDRLGRKRVYIWGFGLFTLASIGCALAGSLAVLIVMRTVQGAGAAMLQANSVAIVTTAAPRARMRAALGLQAAAQAVGLALGPTIGGIVVQTVGWRWVFALNVPVGILAVVSGRYLLPRTRLGERQPGGVRDVVRAPGVRRSLVGALLAYLLLFGPIVLVPAVLQQHGCSALVSGAVVAGLPLGFAVGALGGERLLPVAWTSGRRCRLGLAFAAAGLGGLFAGIQAGGATAAALLVLGVGLGVFTPTNNATIMGQAPAGVAAVAGGLVSATRAAGTGLATLLVALTLGTGWALPTAVLLGLCLAAPATIARAPR